MTTNIANPILYAWLNASFKKLFVHTLTQTKTNERNKLSSKTSLELKMEWIMGYAKSASIVKVYLKSIFDVLIHFSFS